MPLYRWEGNGVFYNNRTGREVAVGETVELPERVVGNHDFVEVSEEAGDAASESNSEAEEALQAVTENRSETLDTAPDVTDVEQADVEVTEDVTAVEAEEVAESESVDANDGGTDDAAQDEERYRCLSTDTQDGTPCQIEVDGPDETCWNH